MQIRPAHPADAESIAKIYNLHVSAGGVTFDVEPWEPSRVARWLPTQPPEGWYVSVDESQQIQGWSTLRRISERQGFRHTCECATYLDPLAIGTGIADELLAALEKHCVEHRIHHIMARIISDNHRSIAFHEKHGFETIGIQREIGRLQNRWVHLTVMQRLIAIEDASL